MSEIAAKSIREQPRFEKINKIWKKENRLSLTDITGVHLQGEEEGLVKEALLGLCRGEEGKFSEKLEKQTADYVGTAYAVAVNSGTAALHLAVKLAAERLYGSSTGIVSPKGVGNAGCLAGKRVFCPDFASFSAVAPVIYEGGEPIFIDAGEDWGMDPEVLEMAFERYPEVKLVIFSHIYGFPGQITEVKEVCRQHEALLIEDASGSLGASVFGEKAGSVGDYGILSFGNDKIITGNGGGMLLTSERYSAEKAKRWATGAHTKALWAQHDELGYNYRMNDITAAVVSAQFSNLETNIEKKRKIYETYQDKFDGDLIQMNLIGNGAEANYWISCAMVISSINFEETRSDREYTYNPIHGTASPMQILEALEAFGIHGEPVWKPMHMQPLFCCHEQMTLDGGRRAYGDFYADDYWIRSNESKYIFQRSLCLPSDIGMTEEEQEMVIEIVGRCFD